MHHREFQPPSHRQALSTLIFLALARLPVRRLDIPGDRFAPLYRIRTTMAEEATSRAF